MLARVDIYRPSLLYRVDADASVRRPRVNGPRLDAVNQDRCESDIVKGLHRGEKKRGRLTTCSRQGVTFRKAQDVPPCVESQKIPRMRHVVG
jgi:hypothetical protein